MTLLAPPECGSSRLCTVQIAWLRPAFAILVALVGSTADAGPQAVPRAYQAGFYLEGCKDFLAGKSDFLSGRCVGAVEVIDDLGSGTKLFCPPEATNNLERVRVIVAYIEARPERMKDGFGLLANEAMAKAWPCKN
jgi:Rap1a immunity proteins